MEKKEIKKASALAYTPGEDKAPKVIASGKGVIAEKILEVAKEVKIPVVEDAHLADTLDKLRVGSEIPAELYDWWPRFCPSSAVWMKKPEESSALSAVGEQDDSMAAKMMP